MIADHPTPTGPAATSLAAGPAAHPTDEPCPAHHNGWLAAAIRSNRRNLGYEPQPCTMTPTCEAMWAADDAHHEQVRADCETARARLAAHPGTS